MGRTGLRKIYQGRQETGNNITDDNKHELAVGRTLLMTDAIYKYGSKIRGNNDSQEKYRRFERERGREGKTNGNKIKQQKLRRRTTQLQQVIRKRYTQHDSRRNQCVEEQMSHAEIRK